MFAPKPENVTWTDDQWKAIVASGQNILVAAAAGSGKTAVLVERLIRKITDQENPLDVDRLLVVTFTNASAAEMKERIGKALEVALEKDFTSAHLRKQLQLINKASISTLHAFCLNVIRQYYYLIDIDPKFRIANDAEIQMLEEEVMEEMLEEHYGRSDNELFFSLIDCYTNDRGDALIQEMILKLFKDSKAHPNPHQWLDNIVSLYHIDGKTIDEIPYGEIVFSSIKLNLEGEKERVEQGINIALSPNGPEPYLANFVKEKEMIENLLSAENWQEMFAQMEQLKWGRLAACKKSDYDELLIDKAKNVRDKVKKNIDKIKTEFFTRKPASLLGDMEKMAPLVAQLILIVKEFDSRFQEKKAEKGIVDFSDLEHYCLTILQQNNEPSEVALGFREKFAEVLVDEYQDTNLVQERILQLVSKEGAGNLFMVGDVKQSIYRFRLAEPTLFLNKHEQFTKDGSANGLRIDLSKNFRSRAEVLDATNYIFKQIMGKTVGEIVYDEDAQLKLGATYPKSDVAAAELIVINQETAEEEDTETEDLEKAQLEGRMIARKIKEMMKNGYQVFDKHLQAMRPVTYRDFVILLRSMPWSTQMTEELKAEGIPVYAELSGGYFEATEVAIMMNVLRIIDNPNQDIALASVLRSPIIDMSNEELAELRANGGNGSFYTTMISYSGASRGKIDFLMTSLQKWRELAKRASLSDLIWQIYRDTGYFDFVGGMSGGKQRQANLRVLYDRARQYENTSFRGLFRFIRFVERLIARGDDLGTARALGEQEDVVRMMTIHKSKGLEFPVVFLSGMGKKFNLRDLSGTYLLHKDLGFGSKYIDPNIRISYPTLPQLAIKKKKEMESIAEEMRVLYVAMTRAKEKLVMIGTVANKEKTAEKWREMELHQEWLLPDTARASGRCYLDWIGIGIIRHQTAEEIGEERVAPLEIKNHPTKWQVSFVEKGELSAQAVEKVGVEEDFLQYVKQGELVPFESERKEEVEQMLNWQYHFREAVSHSAKQSVSEIKRNRQLFSEDGVELIKPAMNTVKPRPRFVEKKKMTSAERGTAMHMVMQQLQGHKNISEEEVLEQVAKMVNEEFLTEEQGENIDVTSIVKFYQTWIGQKLLTSEKVEKEVPFTLQISAREVYPDWQHEEDENILVQGIMDCIIEEEDGIILVDYKTDNIRERFNGDFEQAKPVLLERYALQLYLYGQALERILDKSVKGKFLYFFDGGNVLEVK